MVANPCFAHRGWSGRAPENTMAAFRMALGNSRVTGIELDVQLSRDGQPVVIHDYTLERTTDGSGWVKDTTFTELARLDAGSWYSPAFAKERIPHLDEVLRLAKHRTMLNLELKTTGGLYPELASVVAERIIRNGMEQQVVVTSFDHEAARQVHSLAPAIRTGLLFEGLPPMSKEQLAAAGAAMLSVHYRFITRELADWCEAQQIGLMAWTVDEPEAIQALAAWSPAIWICTNHPDRLLT
ncbi:glycerophosphodiester phosphodiesterase [Paenibacillus sp. y28]|uniref:glycerophosphodiester phosphodiesterase n=1 Tax=Paenibacillus sp. y28 TaxID=3129110 RepID=UPI00301951CA